MCGIAGFVGDWGEADRSAALRRMTARLAHRGPDGDGHWLDPRAALGHRRLAVIDLAGGTQPRVGPSGAVISFNGEIYNYRELRRDLEAAGERFASDSDTEVLLRLYEREGVRALDRLVGMFALAVWDPRRRRLFLARDRLGKKPLYYAHDGNRLAFASEPKALLALAAVAARAQPDPLALSDFLSLGYVQTPKSAYANIRSLPAAHAAEFDAASGTLRLEEYWRLEEHYLAPRLPNAEATRERFAELLSDAVRLRLRADVPVGVFLSGGLDSSAVCALAARHAGAGVRSFCVGFRERHFDESPYAALVADHLGVPLTVLEHESADESLLTKLMWHCDAPFADTSAMPTYLLSHAARRHVTVALTGDGADEILAGYPTHRADAYYRRSRRLPAWAAHGLAGLIDLMPRRPDRKVGWDYKLRQFLLGHGLSPERAHYWWRVVLSDEEKRRAMGPDLAKQCEGYDPFETFAGWFRRVEGAAFLDRTLFVDVKTWLQDDILVKADRMSMAASLEVRSPFLDHRLVEFSARLPVAEKMAPPRQKVILREIMASILPAATLRRPKAGFNAPAAAIARRHPPRCRMPNLLSGDFLVRDNRDRIDLKGYALAAFDAWLETTSCSTCAG